MGLLGEGRATLSLTLAVLSTLSTTVESLAECFDRGEGEVAADAEDAVGSGIIEGEHLPLGVDASPFSATAQQLELRLVDISNDLGEGRGVEGGVAAADISLATNSTNVYKTSE